MSRIGRTRLHGRECGDGVRVRRPSRKLCLMRSRTNRRPRRRGMTTAAALTATAAQSRRKRVVVDDVARVGDGKILVSADAPVIGIGEGDDRKVLPPPRRTVALLRRTVNSRRSSRPPEIRNDPEGWTTRTCHRPRWMRKTCAKHRNFKRRSKEATDVATMTIVTMPAPCR
jgi:hypothetical protein